MAEKKVDKKIIAVTNEHHIVMAQQSAKKFAEENDFQRTVIYYIATSVSELASNLFNHSTQGGTITLSIVQQNGKSGIEIIAEDDGPGIADVNLAMQNGYSTSGGMGCGLSGVKRLMDEFEINSEVGVGTRVAARKWRS
jgi:serine/threonine-protein kinase RsbT